MKYLQTDGIWRKSNKISLTSNEAKVDRHQRQPYQAELIIIIHGTRSYTADAVWYLWYRQPSGQPMNTGILTLMWHGVTWHDGARRDMTWHDMTWHDMTWHDVTWHDVAWRDMRYITWHDVVWRDMTWHDMTWHDVQWREMTWHNAT